MHKLHLPAPGSPPAHRALCGASHVWITPYPVAARVGAQRGSLVYCPRCLVSLYTVYVRKRAL